MSDICDSAQEFMDIMLAKLPPVIAREEVYSQLGGIVKPKTLINADSAGVGPKRGYKVGRKVVYETRALLEWIIERQGVSALKNITELLEA